MHLTAHLDIDLLALSTDEEVTCLVELTAPTPPELVTRPGQAVIVVLDRSGSMGGAPLDAARTAIADLVRRLAPQDHFGLVTFDDEVQLPVPVARIADRSLDELLAAIDGIRAGGSTDLSAGYLMGLREADRALRAAAGAGGAGAGAGGGALSGASVLVLSDGQANAGITDPARLAELATEAQRGAAGGAADGAAGAAAGAVSTTTSTLGLGEHYDEVILAALARGGSGEHRYAPDVDAAVAEFGGLVDDLLGKSVTGALLRIHPQQVLVDGIIVHGALPNWADAGAVVVNLGDLYGGEERRVLVGFRVPALAQLGTTTVANLELTYTSLPDLVLHTVDLPVSVNVVPGDEARGRVPDPRVRVERLIAEVDDVKRTASEQLRAGDADTARASLAAAIARAQDGRSIAGDDEQLNARVEATVTDLVELERTSRERSREYASKLAMESWNQTSRGKARRRSRHDEPQPHASGRVSVAAGIDLVVGDIAHQYGVDALVNAANSRLTSGAGVSGALHAAAGPELREACRALGPVDVGDAVATPGFRLGAAHVIHAVGPQYGIDEPSDVLLASAHRRALEVADALGCRTLAMPALSTGVFGYPVEEAARIALTTVRDTLARCTTLEQVTFVLFDRATHDTYRLAALGS